MEADSVESLVFDQTARIESLSLPWSDEQCLDELRSLPKINPEIGAEKPQAVLQDATNLETIMLKGLGESYSSAFNEDDFLDDVLEGITEGGAHSITRDDWAQIGDSIHTDEVMNEINQNGIMNIGQLPMQDEFFALRDDLRQSRASLDDISFIARKHKTSLHDAAISMSHWSREKRNDELSRSRVKQEFEDGDFGQDVENVKSFDEINEREQIRLLERILDIWKSYNGAEPLYFWEILTSDSYSETIENIFFFTFLSNKKLVCLWDAPEYNTTVFVPNYDIIAKSAFGKTDKITGNRNKKRVRYECNERLKNATKEHLNAAEKQTDKIHSKYSKAKYELAAGPGRHVELSRNGSFSLSMEDWEAWVKYLKATKAKNGQTWQKMIPSRPLS